MSMHQIVQEVKALREVAARDPVNFGPTGPAIAAAARQAKDRIAELTKEYGELVKEGAVAIFLLTDDPREFASIAKEDFGTINLDSQELYRRIAAYIVPGLGPHHEFGAHQAGQMVAALRELGEELGMNSMPAPKHTILPVVVKDEKEVTDYIRSVIRASMGDELNLNFLERKLVAQTLEAGFTNPAVPVLIIGAEEGEIEALSKLFKVPSSTVKVTGPVNKDVVTKKFTEIKNKLRTSGKK